MEDQSQIIKNVAEPLSQARFWMKLMAVMLMLSALGAVITIWGIVFAWLPVWLGVLLWQAANSAEDAQRTGRAAMLAQSLNKMKIFFMIYGIITILAFGGGILAALIIPRFMMAPGGF